MRSYTIEYRDTSGVPVDCTVGLRSKASAKRHGLSVATDKGYAAYTVSLPDNPIPVLSHTMPPAKVPLTVFEECHNGINLDGEDVGALESFAHYRGTVEGVRLFTDITAPSTRVRALRLTARYAGMKAMAMRARLAGCISVALSYEGYCERLYTQMPAKARW